MALPSRSHLEGTLLRGRYRVGRLLGVGGMGAVYEATQEDLGRRVAIKVSLPEVGDATDDVEARRRFSREARAAAALHHPNIVAVTDFFAGDANDPAFLVMELLEGKSLARAIVDEGHLPPDRVVSIATQILAALEVAHAAGLVHRDIKPDNVFLVPVTGASGGELVKVLDFGIVKHARGVGATTAALTATGAVLGTPAYMSPEQARGRDVDARSDLYSVGALMYHALSGRTPFTAPSFNALLFAIAEEDPPPLSSIRADLPAALARIVAHAMAKSVDARHRSASEMRAALAALGNPSTLRSGIPAADPRLAYAPTFASEPPGPPRVGPSAAPAALAGAAPSSTPRPAALTVGDDARPPPATTGDARAAGPARSLRGAFVAGAIVVVSIAAIVGFAVERRSGVGVVAASSSSIASVIPQTTMAPIAAIPSASSIERAPIASTSIAPAPVSTASIASPVGASPPRVRSTVAPAPTSTASADPARKRTGGTKPYVSFIDTNRLYEIDTVRDAVNARLSAIAACFVAAEYDAVDHQFPMYALTIDDGGAVLAIAPPGTDDRDQSLDSCIELQLGAIVFGPPHGRDKRRLVVGLTARHD